MIVWVSKNYSGRPNNQRAEVIVTDLDTKTVEVKFCGDEKVKVLPITAICGIEITDGCDLFFKQTGLTIRQYYYPNGVG